MIFNLKASNVLAINIYIYIFLHVILLPQISKLINGLLILGYLHWDLLKPRPIIKLEYILGHSIYLFIAIDPSVHLLNTIGSLRLFAK